MIFLSGTLTEPLRNCLVEKFCFQKDDCSHFENNCINENLTMLFKEIKDNNLVTSALSHVKSQKLKKVLIIFCSIEKLEEAFDIYEGEKWKMHRDTKQNGLISFRDSPEGILFATSAVGEGLNVPDLQHVIIVGTAFSLLKLVQFAARARKKNPQLMVFWQRTHHEDTSLALIPVRFHDYLKALVTNQGFFDFASQSKCCRLVALRKSFQQKGDNACYRCDICLAFAAQDMKPALDYDDLQNVNQLQSIDLLFGSCIICALPTCSGLPCQRLLRILEQRNGNWVKTCFNCYQSFCAFKQQTSKNRIERQYNDHLEKQKRSSSGYCTRIPYAVTGSHCHICMLPHDILDRRHFNSQTSHMDGMATNKLRSLLCLFIRTQNGRKYLKENAGIDLGNKSPPHDSPAFNAEFYFLCQSQIKGDTSTPRVILMLNSIRYNPNWNKRIPFANILGLKLT
uniref:Helicase C-terminal domain-containing protein n=1 Tax=Aplanochytrium stocchinoi TaxID=215587 RepID=A0A7S3PM51_9STRA